MMRRASLLLLMLAPAPAAAQAPTDPAAFADDAQIKGIVADMASRMRDGRGYLDHPLVKDGTTVAALEYWKKPGRPAVHPDEAEYAIVIEGSGTLISGGTMTGPKETRSDLIEGDKIDGGTTRNLSPGDVLLVPAGVPHWFGITGDRLVLLGMKIPKRAN